MSYFLAVGCSHTAGVGIKPSEIYVERISEDLAVLCRNLSRGGSNSEYALEQIVKTLREDLLPAFIIAQWPNIYRKTFWNDKNCYFENVNNGTEIFKKLLKQNKNNFIQPWIQHIITADTLADALNVPIYHICLEHYEDQPVEILAEHGIKLHMDFGKPGETWYFDSASSDKVHHSAKCHRAWADRLIRIINENTT